MAAVVPDGHVLNGSVIPHCNVTRLPAEAASKLRLSSLFIKKIQDWFGLFASHALKVCGEPDVNENSQASTIRFLW